MDAIFFTWWAAWLFCQKCHSCASNNSLFLALGLVLVSGRRECLWGVLGVFVCTVEPRDTWNIRGCPRVHVRGKWMRIASFVKCHFIKCYLVLFYSSPVVTSNDWVTLSELLHCLNCCLCARCFLGTSGTFSASAQSPVLDVFTRGCWSQCPGHFQMVSIGTGDFPWLFGWWLWDWSSSFPKCLPLAAGQKANRQNAI